MNKFYFTGRLTKDAEIRTTSSGNKLAKFCVAVNRRVKNEDHPEADFFWCQAWNQIAELIVKYCHKGDKVGIIGHVQTGKYQDKDGVEHERFEIVVDEIEFLSEKRQESSPMPPEPVDPPSQLPFEI